MSILVVTVNAGVVAFEYGEHGILKPRDGWSVLNDTPRIIIDLDKAQLR